MENWQVDHITKNLVELLENTDVNILLLCELKAADVLSDTDIDNINVKETKREKAHLFYERLKTRTNAYYTLISILNKQKQTGAAQVLVDGIPFDAIKNIQITLFGEIFTLNENDIEQVQSFLKRFMTTKEHIEIFTHTPIALTILKETIPPSIPYYVSRKLEKRTTIDPRLFRAPCNDVFVFTNINIIGLSQVIPAPNIPDISTRQLMEISVRFISLQSKDHWDGLKRISKQPIHLITRDEINKTYKLEATLGRSKILRQFLTHSMDESSNISEAEFMENCGNSSSICVCDRPGMGKSVLLANIARVIKAKEANKIVGFIQLSYFAEMITSVSKLQEFTESYVKRLIFSVLSPNKLAAAILLQLDSKRNFPMDLFFDGFDEVKDVQLTLKLLSAIRSLPNCRIFITSRSHMRYELEDTLDILAFNILPFTEDDQVNCVVGIWKSEHKLGNETKLNEFAKICLDEFNSIVHDTNSSITGIAFQCFLLADVHSAQACNYATITSGDIPIERVVFHSLCDIYQKYVDIRITREPSIEKRKHIKLFHAWHALKVVFPEIAQAYLELHKLPLEDYSKFLIYGLLEEHHTGDISTHKFLHRTVAEYLVAEVIENSLLDNYRHWKHPRFKEIIRFIYCTLFTTQKERKFVFNAFILQPLCNGYIDRGLVKYPDFDIYSFRYNIVLYFLNFRLRSPNFHGLTSTTIENLPSYDRQIEHLTNTLVSCAYHNFQYILRLLHPFFPKPTNFLGNILRTISWSYRTLSSKVMLIAARYSDINTIDEFARILRLYFDTLHGYNIRNLYQLTPISVAIQRGNLLVFKYFQRMTFVSSTIEVEFWRLNLRFCLGQSTKDSLEVLNQKIHIIQFILYHMKHSTNACVEHLLRKSSAPNSVPPPLVTSGIHMNLLKFLVEKSAKIDISDEFNDTLLLQAATSLSPMSGDDYHELICYLSEIHGAGKLFTTKNCKSIAPLHNAVENVTNLRIDTLEIIVRLGRYSVTDFQTANKKKSLLLSALDGSQSRDVVEFIIRNQGYMIHNSGTLSCFISSDYLLHLISQQIKLSVLRELKDPLTYTPQGALLKVVKIGIVDPIVITCKLYNDLLAHFSKTVFSEGDTLLHLFAQCNVNSLYAICDFLSGIEISMAFERKNNAGRTPFHEAVFCKNVSKESIKLLVRLDKDINSLDQQGKSILKTALDIKLDYNLVKLLKELGAKVDIKLQNSD